MLQFIDIEGWQSLHQFLSIIFLKKFIHKIKCKKGHDDKECETFGIKYQYWNYFLEHKKTVKNTYIRFSCVELYISHFLLFF